MIEKNNIIYFLFNNVLLFLFLLTSSANSQTIKKSDKIDANLYHQLNSSPTEIKFEKISLGDPSIKILSIVQDKYGFMWFATSRLGLYRYDGYSYKEFTMDSGINATGGGIRRINFPDCGIWI